MASRIFKLYYATNRNHEGADRWRPMSYGKKFSDDGMENLRFGKATLPADEGRIKNFLNATVGGEKGDGEGLAGYFTGLVGSGKLKIEAYPEKTTSDADGANEKNTVWGSQLMFPELKDAMENNTDTLVYIHGYNVSWSSAVGSALALQEMLNRPKIGDPKQNVLVVLFSWPSDGLAIPIHSYKSDRMDAKGSGSAVGRAFLKLRDYFIEMRDKAKGGEPICGQDIHLLCHSMGNYVLQNSLGRIDQFTPGTALPRLFEHIFLCAPDVDDNALEPGNPMAPLHELARSVTIYHNRQDLALYGSDHTKGNPERLGSGGVARPALLHTKIHQVDCTPIVHGLIEHSYYQWGPVNEDILLSIDGTPHEKRNRRVSNPNFSNLWTMK